MECFQKNDKQITVGENLSFLPKIFQISLWQSKNLIFSKICNNFGTLIFSENNQNVIIVQTQHI